LMFQLLKRKGIHAQKPWIDKDGDGILDAGTQSEFAADLISFVVDANKDTINDITGLAFGKSNALGYRYGFIDEEKDKEIRNYEDKDNDGMFDNYARRFAHDMKKSQLYDDFIDEDGDGIRDGRGFKRMDKRRGGQGYGKKKGP